MGVNVTLPVSPQRISYNPTFIPAHDASVHFLASKSWGFITFDVIME